MKVAEYAALKTILLESDMRNISAKLFCICTSAEFRLSFQLVEILTLQVSLAEIRIYHDFILKYDILDPYTRIS